MFMLYIYPANMFIFFKNIDTLYKYVYNIDISFSFLYSIFPLCIFLSMSGDSEPKPLARFQNSMALDVSPSL